MSIRTIPLVEIVKSPSFAVVRAEEKANGQKTRIEMEFKRPGVDVRYSPTNWARVVFDVDHDWCVLEYEEVTPKARTFGNVEYGDADGLWYPRKWTQLILGPDGSEKHGVGLDDYEVTNIEFKPVSEAKFLLSAFGLPEPEVATKSRGGLSIWAIIAMLTFFGAACVAVSRRLFKAR